MTKLNPCPRCGSEPDIFERNSRDISFQASCGECGDETFIVSNSANGAMNAWNAATGEQPAKTLRDEFAMAAHIDKLMVATLLKEFGVEEHSYQDFAELEARMRYIFADAMIKERSK